MDVREKINQILPVGSIVLLKEAKKKIMIVAIMQMQKGKMFEYMGVLYPEGYMGTKHCYLFNTDDIEEVVWRGYEDDERKVFLDILYSAYEQEKQVLSEENDNNV